MARYRVMCTIKHDKYERITSLGCYDAAGVFTSFTEDQVIDMIDNRKDTFYVERPAGHVIDLEVAERDGKKYIKTIADGEKPDNLLSLPTCPAKDSTTKSAASILTSVVAARSHGPSEHD